jgi:hypothetical protein
MRKARSRKPRDGDRKSDAHNEIALAAESASAQEAACAERQASPKARPQSKADEMIFPAY